MDMIALVTLMRDISEIDNEIAALTSTRAAKRAELEKMVVDAGGTVTVPTVGTAYMQGNSYSTSYDVKGMEALISSLIDAGHDKIAKAIFDNKRITPRTGGLRIRLEKNQVSEDD